MTGEGLPAPPELFRQWAKAAGGTALHRRYAGDFYGERLAIARAEVYDDAADLLDDRDTPDAVAEMLRRAGWCRVLVPPLVHFDPAGLRYIRARAWQLCAHTLDLNAPLVQPRWD